MKEQMAGLYAERLAEKGFISPAFDFSNYGESEGLPRFYECPAQKVTDIKNAMGWLAERPDVRAGQMGALGISPALCTP